MKKNKFSVLGMLVMVLALGFVLTGCLTNAGNDAVLSGGGEQIGGEDEPNIDSNSITITGFNWEDTGMIFVYVTNNLSRFWPPVANGRTDKIGSDVTVELKDGTDETDRGSWTGTGKYYIWIQVAPIVPTGPGQRRVYLYTTDGIIQKPVDDANLYDPYNMDGISNAASIDINTAITTLDFSKFVYRGKDHTAG